MDQVEFFCFWECGYIGANVDTGDELIPLDLSLEEAKRIRDDLDRVIAQYERLGKEFGE